MSRLIITNPQLPAESQISDDPIEACAGLCELYPQVKRLVDELKKEKLERATAYSRGYNDGFDQAIRQELSSDTQLFVWSPAKQQYERVRSAYSSTTSGSSTGWTIMGGTSAAL